MIPLAWIVTIGSLAGLTAALAWIWSGTRQSGENVGKHACHGLSLERYQVMERLLCSRDLEYLSAQPGFRPDVAGRWKRESVRIFRLYLSELTRDFHALHAHARRMVAESHSASPELAATLVRQQVAFFRARTVLEWRVFLFRLGVGSVDVAPLLHMVEAMRIDLGRLVPEGA